MERTIFSIYKSRVTLFYTTAILIFTLGACNKKPITASGYVTAEETTEKADTTSIGIYQQEENELTTVNITLNWKGTIGKHPIFMHLEWDTREQKITGEYYYLTPKNKSKIFLHGSIIDHNIYLTEYIIQNSEKVKTGEFQFNAEDLIHLKGNWQKSKNARPLQVNLNIQETQVARVHLFNFMYQIQNKKLDTESDSTLYPFIQELVITQNHKEHQVIVPTSDAINLFNNESKKYTIALEDINFDGFLDLKIPISFPNLAQNDYSYLYFIYNPESEIFISRPDIDELGVLFFDNLEKKAIRYEADGNGNERTYIYQWNNHNLELTRKETVTENSDSTLVTEYKTTNKKTEETKTYKIPFSTQ